MQLMSELVLSGRRLQIAPLMVGQLVEVERRIVAQMRDPLEVIIARWDAFSDVQRRQLLEAAFEHLARPPAVPLGEIVAWMNTPRGTAYALWLSARELDPSLTWDECERLVLAASPHVLEEIQRALAPEWWEDALGNSLGQTQPNAAAGAACTVS